MHLVSLYWRHPVEGYLLHLFISYILQSVTQGFYLYDTGRYYIILRLLSFIHANIYKFMPVLVIFIKVQFYDIPQC